MAAKITGACASRATSAVVFEPVAGIWRARVGDAGPVVAYDGDDEKAMRDHVARRQRMGAELVVVASEPVPVRERRESPWSATNAPGDAMIRGGV